MCPTRASANWPISPCPWTASTGSTSANRTCLRRTTSSRPPIRAMHDGFTYYTENAGLPSLRRAIAAYYARLHAVELDPATEIVVTASGVQALNVGIRAVLDPGDEALVLTPAWPNGAANVALANAVPRDGPAPAVRRPLRGRFRRPRTRRHSAHAAAHLHVAIESARLGGHRGGAARGCSSSPGGTGCGCLPTKSTTASTTPARGWACRRPPSCG